MTRDEALDDAIFKRMKRDDRESSSRGEQGHGLIQPFFELFKLLIDVNPYSLKGARCRVLRRVLTIPARAHDTCHEIGKLACARNRSLCAASHNRLCNLKSKPFFPMIANHLLNFFRGCGVEPIGRGDSARGVHAHVERTVVSKREPA